MYVFFSSTGTVGMSPLETELHELTARLSIRPDAKQIRDIAFIFLSEHQRADKRSLVCLVLFGLGSIAIIASQSSGMRRLRRWCCDTQGGSEDQGNRCVS